VVVQAGEQVVAVLPDRHRGDDRRVLCDFREHIHAHALRGDEAVLLRRVVRVGTHHFDTFTFEGGGDLFFHGFLRGPADLVGRKAQVARCNKVSRLLVV
jgi:hypothetical protein